MDFLREKIKDLEAENRSLKAQYNEEHKLQEHYVERIAAMKRLLDKKQKIINRYVEKYGLLDWFIL